MSTPNAPGNYDARLCISYLDEAEAFYVPDKFLKSIVSLTALKTSYIVGLENDWKGLRIKYKVPQGVYLHFSQIKNLLNSKTINSDPACAIFIKADDTVDYSLLYNFYTDIQSIIRQNNFIIQGSGIEYPKKSIEFPNGVSLNSEMYQLFYVHLDRMAFYLIDLATNDYKNRISIQSAANNLKAAKNVDFRYYFSKLRYDGGYDLRERNEYRNAYSHCISDGTQHFNSGITREVFDTLSFIAKSEVALCTNCNNNCTYEFVSHAGDELVDFIALYVARDMWKEQFKEHMINNGKNNDFIQNQINLLTTIKVPGYQPIHPIVDIAPKIFSTPDISSYKLIRDYPY